LNSKVNNSGKQLASLSPSPRKQGKTVDSFSSTPCFHSLTFLSANEWTLLPFTVSSLRASSRLIALPLNQPYTLRPSLNFTGGRVKELAALQSASYLLLSPSFNPSHKGNSSTTLPSTFSFLPLSLSVKEIHDPSLRNLLHY